MTMMTTINCVRTAVTATVLLLTVSLTGCGQITSPSALTIALTATSAESAPSIASISNQLVDHAEAALFPGDGEVRFVTPDATTLVDLTPMRGDQVEASEAKMADKIAENLIPLKATMDGAASTTDGLDVLGVLDQALEVTPTGGKVILITSGFSTTSPIDLNASGDWIGHPSEFAALVTAEDLPNASGKEIIFLGLGYPEPASAQAVAGPAARAALTTIMLDLCKRMNATSCTTLPGPAGTEKPTSTNQVTPVNLDQIRTHCVGEMNIDSNISFELGSPLLLPAADTVLIPLADSLKTCPSGTVVSTIGHSSLEPGQNPGDDTLLEQQRAQAVLSRLQELGVPQGSIGQAAPGGQILDNTPNGIYDPTLAVKNRVVTLIVTTR
jgi:hypothetical protein